MGDGIRDIEIIAIIAAFAVFVILPIQLFLCFRAKKLLFKFLPPSILAATTVFFFVMMRTTTDWNAIGYAVLFIFSCVLLLFSGVGFGIWAITKLIKKKRAD